MFWKFLTWARERRCRHDYRMAAATAVSGWTPQEYVNFSEFPPRPVHGAYRHVRAHMECQHCGKRMLSQGLETSIAGGFHAVNLHDWDAAILNSRR
jgi:hypothetical protein